MYILYILPIFVKLLKINIDETNKYFSIPSCRYER